MSWGGKELSEMEEWGRGLRGWSRQDTEREGPCKALWGEGTGFLSCAVGRHLWRGLSRRVASSDLHFKSS